MTKDRQPIERTNGKTAQWVQTLETLYDDFQKHSGRALKDYDSEAVHQARVNSRKLLTLLSILDPGHSTAPELYRSIKRAQRRLGTVRDADVFIASLKQRRQAAKEAGQDRTAELLKSVIRHQKKERGRLRDKLTDKLPELTGKELGRQWEAFIAEEAVPLAAARDVNVLMRELEVAFEQKKQACKQILKAADSELDDGLEQLHELRIAAKQLRYTASAAGFALSSKFHAAEDQYKQVQEQLGKLNDLRVGLKKLENLDRKSLDIRKKDWNTFTGNLRAELYSALRGNEVVPAGPPAAAGRQ